jgi:hypothetical protein
MPACNINGNISLLVSTENLNVAISADFARAVALDVRLKHVYGQKMYSSLDFVTD